MSSVPKYEWRYTCALIALSIVPLIAGIVRLVRLATHHSDAMLDARFISSPVPVSVHVISSLGFCVIGAFQFNSKFRAQSIERHRFLGRIVFIAGILAAISGLWMTATYAIPEPLQGPTLYVVRYLVGTAMFFALIISWKSAVSGEIDSHRAWIVRAYALGQGAGTQVLIILPATVIAGEVTGFPRDILMSLTWVINALFAEALIRGKLTRAKPVIATAASRN